MEKKCVVIVGGGVSGLAAASALSVHDNFDVTVLEAENRIGGRIHTVDYFGEKIELGAQYIHGKEGNALYEFLSKHLEPSEFQLIAERYGADQDSYVLFTSGKELTSEEQKCFHESRNLLESINCDIKERLQSSETTEDELKDISLKEYAEKIWNKEYTNELDKPQSEAIRNNVYTMMSIVDGARAESCGCLLYDYYEEQEADVILRRSFSVFIDILKKTIPHSCIKLNSKVKGIYWNPTAIETLSNDTYIANLSGNAASTAECLQNRSSNYNGKDSERLHGPQHRQKPNYSNNALRIPKAPSHTSKPDTTENKSPQSSDKNASNHTSSFAEKLTTTESQVIQAILQAEEVAAIKNEASNLKDQNVTPIVEKGTGMRATKSHLTTQQGDYNNLDGFEDQEKVQVSYVDDTGCARFIAADHVIVTVSLGVLKKYHKELFQPNLPIRQQQCIEKMGFGTVGKLFIHFGKKIWDDSEFELHVLCDTEYSNSDRRSWCKELELIEIFNGRTLIVWLNKLALEKIKALTKDEIWQHLFDIIKGHCHNTIPTPDDIIVTQWGDNENFLGSYSFTAIGETRETRKIAREPISVNGVPRILFAGEAFHENRFGTVDGAYQTGLREAKRIVESYRKMA